MCFYVEQYGLENGARVENVLMSMPLRARWEYCHEPAPGSEEARIQEVLKHPKNWLEPVEGGIHE